VIVQQKVHGLDIRHLEAIDGLAVVLVRPEHLADLLHGQETAEPVPFVVVAYEEADVAVGALVARAAEDDFAHWEADGWPEGVEGDWVFGLVGWLLAVVGAEFWG
jgi:hypothetical protein